jgi:hypothetical protein
MPRGVVRSEFHSRRGMDMSAVPRVEPGRIVEASLTDLADGVLVSAPGLSDTESMARLGCSQPRAGKRGPDR